MTRFYSPPAADHLASLLACAFMLVLLTKVYNRTVATLVLLIVAVSITRAQRSVDLIIPVEPRLVDALDRDALAKLSIDQLYKSVETVVFGFAPRIVGLDSSISVRLPRWVAPCGSIDFKGTMVDRISDREYNYFGKYERSEDININVGDCPDAYFDITHTKTGFWDI